MEFDKSSENENVDCQVRLTRNLVPFTACRWLRPDVGRGICAKYVWLYGTVIRLQPGEVLPVTLQVDKLGQVAIVASYGAAAS